MEQTAQVLVAGLLSKLAVDSGPRLFPLVGAADRTEGDQRGNMGARPVLSLPLSRASTTSVQALWTAPLPMGRPWRWKSAYWGFLLNPPKRCI